MTHFSVDGFEECARQKSKLKRYLRSTDNIYHNQVYKEREVDSEAMFAAEKERDLQQAYAWNIRAGDGVDPFNLLRPEPIQRVPICDIPTELERLRNSYACCSKDRLSMRTNHLFSEAIRYELCSGKELQNGAELLAHFMGTHHQQEMKRASGLQHGHINRAALTFWIDAATTCARYAGMTEREVAREWEADAAALKRESKKNPQDVSLARRAQRSSHRSFVHSLLVRRRFYGAPEPLLFSLIKYFGLLLFSLVFSFVAPAFLDVEQIRAILILIVGVSLVSDQRIIEAVEDGVANLAARYLRFVGELE